jgi:large subunit ribosomal protein L18
MNRHEIKNKRRLRRKNSVRAGVHGSAERLRLTVTKSLKHFYAQIINDDEMKTVISASTVDAKIRELINPKMTMIELSKIVGQEIGKRAKEANLNKVVFDRNGFLYHGRIKAFADAAREAGLDF